MVVHVLATGTPNMQRISWMDKQDFMMRLLSENFIASDKQELIDRGFIDSIKVFYYANRPFTLCDTKYQTGQIIQIEHLD